MVLGQRGGSGWSLEVSIQMRAIGNCRRSLGLVVEPNSLPSPLQAPPAVCSARTSGDLKVGVMPHCGETITGDFGLACQTKHGSSATTRLPNTSLQGCMLQSDEGA